MLTDTSHASADPTDFEWDEDMWSVEILITRMGAGSTNRRHSTMTPTAWSIAAIDQHSAVGARDEVIQQATQKPQIPNDKPTHSDFLSTTVAHHAETEFDLLEVNEHPDVQDSY